MAKIAKNCMSDNSGTTYTYLIVMLVVALLLTDDFNNLFPCVHGPCCASDPVGPVGSCLSCPSGFRLCAGRCLSRLRKKMNYTEAETACEDHLGAHLAVPCSETENQCALVHILGKAPVWLGVTDRDIEGTFVGVEGTCSPAPASEDWWESGEPDLVDKVGCVALSADKGWFDLDCGAEASQLCQLRDC